MSSTALCDWCSQIPFRDLPDNRMTMERPSYDLGSGSRVKESSCPFCQLVTQAHCQNHSNIVDQENIDLSWISGLGFAFRVPIPGQDVSIAFGLLESSRDVALAMRAKHPERCLLQPTGSLIDTSRVLGWIRTCEEDHEGACQLPSDVPFVEAFRGLPLIRLIDVEAGCLVELQRLEKYIALSYVWGGVANFRLTKTNRPILLRPGSLNKVSEHLPGTIRDAIALVQRLGYRYLWADSLCLVQNDTDDLDRGVDSMDLIYERAWLTIIAACGHDANARLPGVQEGTRKPSSNSRLVSPGIAMGVVVAQDDLLDCSMWDSRAWTFQEGLLSRRALYFVDDRLFFRCRRSEQAEHLVDLYEPGGPIIWTGRQSLRRTFWGGDPLEKYSRILLFYTKRALTNQNDGPRAMAGIMKRFSDDMGCRFLEGLPTATFDFFLAFRAIGGTLRRRLAFPSYSWTGWSGQILSHAGMTRLENPNTTLIYETWIIWYKRSPSGIVSLVWDPSCEPNFPLDNMEYLGYRQRLPFSYGRYTPAQLDTSRITPSETVSFTRNVPPYHILQFWTMSVFCTISDINVFEATADLMDSNGEKCGSVWLDGFEEMTWFESQTCFEAILLSESKVYENRRLESYVKDVHICTRPWPSCFVVLLLEWKGGLAERRGSGHIIEGAIVNSLAPGPVWKEILLA